MRKGFRRHDDEGEADRNRYLWVPAWMNKKGRVERPKGEDLMGCL